MSLTNPTLFLGGPLTILPRPIESLLCWTLSLSCLSVSGYHYLVNTYIKPYLQLALYQIRSARRTIQSADDSKHSLIDEPSLPCWLPLMTSSRAEQERGTPQERIDQVLVLLLAMGRESIRTGGGAAEIGIDSTTPATSTKADVLDRYRSDHSAVFILTDDELVSRIRNNEILRRLVSLAMRPDDSTTRRTPPNCSTNQRHGIDNHDHQRSALRRQLIRIWPELLRLPLPPTTRQANGRPLWDVSLIVPCYQESISDIEDKLTHALQQCAHPQRVQVLLVLAGMSMTTALVQDPNQSTFCWFMNMGWGNAEVLPFPDESGRGPCLNYGAKRASGLILAFCHSDTKLPWHWDVMLRHTLDDSVSCTGPRPVAPTPGRTRRRRSNACAFGFGIDISPTGLKGGAIPPGIQAVATTANWRCRLWSLPYGDQCLALRAIDFQYLGGFPHQCFMEDYELIALLRQTCAVVVTIPSIDTFALRFDTSARRRRDTEYYSRSTSLVLTASMAALWGALRDLHEFQTRESLRWWDDT